MLSGEGFGAVVARATLAKKFLSDAENCAAAGSLSKTNSRTPVVASKGLKESLEALLAEAVRSNQLVRPDSHHPSPPRDSSRA